MKQNWPTKRLADVCQILGGATPSKKNPKFYGGDIPWATVGDMNVEVITSTEEYITKAAVADCSTNVIPSASIVMATRVGLGKVCVLGQDTAINQDLKGLTPKNPKELINRWLYWWLKSMASDIQKAGTGATVQGVKMTFVQELEIPLPPLAEQKRIVALLDEAFAGIDAAKAKAEASLTLALETLNSFLEKEFNAENSELRPIGDVFTTMTGTTPPKSETSYYGKDVLFVKPPELRGGLITETEDGLSNEGAAVARIAPRNSILVSCIGILGKVGWADKPVAFNQQINAVLPKEDHAHWKYILFQMKSPRFRKSLTEASTGTTVYMVNKSKFNQLTVRLPSLRHQTSAAERFAEIDQLQNELTTNQIKRMEAFNSLKSSLLSQAFAGELTA